MPLIAPKGTAGPAPVVGRVSSLDPIDRAAATLADMAREKNAQVATLSSAYEKNTAEVADLKRAQAKIASAIEALTAQVKASAEAHTKKVVTLTDIVAEAGASFSELFDAVESNTETAAK